MFIACFILFLHQIIVILFYRLRTFLQTILTLIATVEGVQGCTMWCNQIQLIIEGKHEMIGFPYVWLSLDEANIDQWGNNNQRYDPLYINVHIGDWLIDEATGRFEQNLQVFDVADKVRAALQKFTPDNSTSFVYCGLTFDDQHAGVYHLIQKYKTNLGVTDLEEPVGGIPMTDLMPLEVDLTTQQADGNEPYVYNFTPL